MLTPLETIINKEKLKRVKSDVLQDIRDRMAGLFMMLVHDVESMFKKLEDDIDAGNVRRSDVLNINNGRVPKSAEGYTDTF